MNISPVSNNTTVAVSRQVATEATPVDKQQAGPGEVNSSLPNQIGRSVPDFTKSEVSRQALEEAVKQVNDFLKPINDSIQFNVDEDTGKTIVKVIDLTTKEVIRQFPSEEMLSIAKAIDKMKGLLVHQQA